MSETFLSTITAAGGNSRMARSIRARLQWRDRYGRWIEMGRGVKFKVRGSDGATRSVIGSFVGAKDATTGQVYVSKDPNGLPDGFYDVSSSNAQEFVANLDEAQLAERGIELGKDVNGKVVGERASEDVPNVNELVRADAPEGWVAEKGLFGGKKVIQTDDGDFRIHYGGKDDTVLLEDRKGTPGQADPQRSVAEAFKKVSDVDIQREESGDQNYTALSDDAAEKVSSMSRDDKISQIKGNERTLANERAPLNAKQAAMNANNQLKKELEDAGDPYDPEGKDSDEQLAARKNAPEAPTEPDAKPVTTGDIDTSTFDVAPEGFLVPTGKRTDDISAQGLADFMTSEKEQLGKGGSRLVVDTDAKSAEIYNSADTLDNAKAQAGGMGQDTILDLANGRAVPTKDAVPDPDSPDVTPETGAPDAQDRNPDAVEPRADDAGADAPVRDQPDAEADRAEPAGDKPRADAPADRDPAADPQPDGDAPEPERPAAAPGSVEDLKARRAQIQTALDNSGDPKDIIALNEQADELDTRIANLERSNDEAKTRDEVSPDPTDLSPEDRDAPERFQEGTVPADKPRPDSWEPVEAQKPDTAAEDTKKSLDDLAEQINSLEEQQNRLQDELERGASGRADDEISADIDKVFNKLADLQSQYDELDKGKTDENTQPEMSLADKLDSAWAATDPYPDSWIEKRERAALRILRDAEKKGDIEAGKKRLSQEEKDALSDEVAAAVGIERTPQLDIQKRVREDGGLSIAPNLIDEPTDGYMVAVQGHNREIPEDEFFDGDKGAQALVSWINENREALAQPGAHIGLWHDTENKEVVFDVSQRIESREEAERVGRERNQQAIWDVAGGEEIPTGGTGDREDSSADSGDVGRDVPGGATGVGEEGDRASNNPEGTDRRVEGPWRDENRSVEDLQGIRMVSGINEEHVERLAEIYREQGFFGNPVMISTGPNDEIIMDGNHRVEAASRAGLTEIPVRVFDNSDEGRSALNRALVAIEQEKEASPDGPTYPERQTPAYQEPGDPTELANLRQQLADFEAALETEIEAAENASSPREAAEHLAKVRTFTRRIKEINNAINRVNGNAPMDFNKDLGWNMRDPENRGSLPETPEAPTPEPEAVPEADTPAALDDSIQPPKPRPTYKDLPAGELSVGDYIEHPETGNIVRISNIESERDDEERATKFTVSFDSRNDDEDGENNAAGLIELWSDDKVETFTGFDARDGDEFAMDATRRSLAGEQLTPAENRAMQRMLDRERNMPLDQRIERAEREVSELEARRRQALLAEDYDEEEVDQLTNERDWAKYELQELRAQQGEEDAPEDYTPTEAEEEDYAEWANEQREQSLDAEFGPIEQINQAIENRDTELAQVDPGEGTGGLYEAGDDPINVSSGHSTQVEVAKAKLQGKEVSEDERAAIQSALESDALTDNELSRIHKEIDSRPNRANTVTIARPAQEQPEYLSTADMDIINAERDDPNFVFDEDLTWRRILEEFPNATQLENGDLILDTTNNKGKRYDTMIRRTKKNRFLVYVMETDGQGNRRAKRIGNTEWHSYEALEKRISQGRKIIHSSSPAGSIARRKDQPTEHLGTQGFPMDDFLGDIGNPDAPLPSTGDEKFDRLLEAVALHLRNGDADIHDIEAHLQELDPGANAINTIMNAVIGRAQDSYRPDGINPWQMYDGETAQIGDYFDWTDWHEEKDWWLPNGQLNPNRRPNENHGLVGRGRIVGYVRENTDGKGHTYGDHVWVQMLQPDGTWGNWVKRSAQTLRRTEADAPLGLPFFSKKEEWRSSPEALARRFRVPEAPADEPVVTHERPRRDLPQSRRVRFTPRGYLAGYSNVPVPNSASETIGLIARGEVTPEIRPASEARPGMLIARMDDNGNQFVDSIIRVENLGDGGYRIHAARPDGNGAANIDSFVLSGDADVTFFSAPPIKAVERPQVEVTTDRGVKGTVNLGGEEVPAVIWSDNGDGTTNVSIRRGDLIRILKSQFTKDENPDISAEARLDMIDSLSEYDLPAYVEELIRRGLLSPSLTRTQYDRIRDVVRSYNPSNSVSKLIDRLLDMLHVPRSARPDLGI